VEGYKIMYDKVIEEFPGTGYTLAKRIGDEERLQRARQGIFDRSPEGSLNRFRDEGDQVGVGMVAEHLTGKFKIGKEKLIRLLSYK